MTVTGVQADLMIEFAEDRPKWEQIADVIRARIADGTYAPRSRVPSVVALTGEFDVASVTARKALAALRESGEIYTVTGMGSFVAEKATPDQEHPPKA